MSDETVTVQKAWLEQVLADLEYTKAHVQNQRAVVEANLNTLVHAQRRIEQTEIEKAELLTRIQFQEKPVQMRHVKRGTVYDLVCVAMIQTDTPLSDYDQVMVYRGDDGQTWVRPLAEFSDGRFEPVKP
jgi:predicted P-loop ATPase